MVTANVPFVPESTARSVQPRPRCTQVEFAKSISPFSPGGYLYTSNGDETPDPRAIIDNPTLLQRMTGGLVGGQASGQMVNQSPPPSEGIDGQGGYIISRIPAVGQCSVLYFDAWNIYCFLLNTIRRVVASNASYILY